MGNPHSKRARRRARGRLYHVLVSAFVHRSKRYGQLRLDQLSDMAFDARLQLDVKFVPREAYRQCEHIYFTGVLTPEYVARLKAEVDANPNGPPRPTVKSTDSDVGT